MRLPERKRIMTGSDLIRLVNIGLEKNLRPGFIDRLFQRGEVFRAVAQQGDAVAGKKADHDRVRSDPARKYRSREKFATWLHRSPVPARGSIPCRCAAG